VIDSSQDGEAVNAYRICMGKLFRNGHLGDLGKGVRIRMVFMELDCENGSWITLTHHLALMLAVVLRVLNSSPQSQRALSHVCSIYEKVL
jgi:hypothetical protein